MSTNPLAPSDVINLRRGAPGSPALKKCVAMMETAMKHRLKQPDAHLAFQYGPTLGDTQFRKTLAEFLSTEYQDSVEESSLCVTSGASQGLHLLTTILFKAGDVVFTESLTYFLALKVFRDDLRMTLKSIPMDDKGIIPDALEEALKQQMQTSSWKAWQPTERRPFRALLYILPVCHNPTGINLSSDRCQRIVQLAREYDLCVLCDDVYNLLYFPSHLDSPPPRLNYYDKRSDPEFKGNVISNGSFSKLFGPGVRLGWLEAPPRMIDILSKSTVPVSGGSFNHMTACMMTSVISLGLLKPYIEETKLELQEKCMAMCKILQTVSPSVQFTMPKGGYFLWTRLPPSFPMTASELADFCCKEDKVTFFGGEIASPDGAYTDCMRFSFAYLEKETIEEGIMKVAKRISSLTSQ